MNWRREFGFTENDNVNFADVHKRFCELMSGPELLPEEIFRLGNALDAARRELDGGRPT